MDGSWNIRGTLFPVSLVRNISPPSYKPMKRERIFETPDFSDANWEGNIVYQIDSNPQSNYVFLYAWIIYYIRDINYWSILRLIYPNLIHNYILIYLWDISWRPKQIIKFIYYKQLKFKLDRIFLISF